MIILGIETSCDETAAAVVENGTKILSSVVASSVEMHAKSGGIIPEMAAREQLKCILPVIDEALNQSSSSSNQKIKDVDAIAVTVGPGLIGSLLVGVETAKTLAYIWNKPVIPINHLEGHLYANWLDPTGSSPPKFPALGLLVSGGHTDLVLMKNHGRLEWLGGTRDDAAGECFDKTARVLGLGYPGGPAIAAATEQFAPSQALSAIKLPRPMFDSKDFDFSFSGLKTAVINEVNHLKKQQLYDQKIIFQLAHEVQEAISDVLVEKTLKAAAKFKVKSILLAGGVSANQRLREKIQSATSSKPYTLHLPPPKLCTDNAAYIASCAYLNYSPIPWQKITTNPGLTITGEQS